MEDEGTLKDIYQLPLHPERYPIHTVVNSGYVMRRRHRMTAHRLVLKK